MTDIMDQLLEDQRTAMKAKDETKLAAIRMIRSALQNAQIAKGAEEKLSEEDILAVLSKEVRQRREAIDEANKVDRSDIASREDAGLQVVLGYMPSQLSREDIVEEITKIIGDLGATGANDRGKVMGQAMKILKGRADGKSVAGIVDELL
ncbi:MAG: GatB/YqeY domain-containing protein [Chloroflexota bacterium]|jgi:uncharacterized protein YqeY|nr:GatB/YqeY domain-containing protein [Chloroflexota bacterium]|tara:strand:+ start:494 stop:943 length:450 start_codon:yes stop_codon:yes gene_type:complete